jgi:dipeptidyl aminopeptidase/acylaminoacyl peptidase
MRLNALATITSVSAASEPSRIRIPILLVHGDADSIVPIEQSRLAQRVLKKAGKDVRLTTYKDEGHGGWSQEDELQNLKEIVGFFEPHLGQRAAAK